jgi:hypothetical protein
MKIFVLKPSSRWSYCGGGRVVVAETLEAVKALFPDDEIITDEGQETELSFDVWILLETFDTTETKSRVVLNDCNWA